MSETGCRSNKYQKGFTLIELGRVYQLDVPWFPKKCRKRCGEDVKQLSPLQLQAITAYGIVGARPDGCVDERWPQAITVTQVGVGYRCNSV